MMGVLYNKDSIDEPHTKPMKDPKKPMPYDFIYNKFKHRLNKSVCYKSGEQIPWGMDSNWKGHKRSRGRDGRDR